MAATLEKIYEVALHHYHMKLVAGRGGLSNLVDWVHVVEEVDYVHFLKGRELIVTTAMDFSYFLPANIVFGSGKVKKVGEMTKPYGKKALIVTGRSSAKKSGIYDKVKNSLEAAGLTTVLYDKVSQNPLTTTAEESPGFRCLRCTVP